eukprot:2906419-Pleurochrysis_carterae.AAC.2
MTEALVPLKEEGFAMNGKKKSTNEAACTVSQELTKAKLRIAEMEAKKVRLSPNDASTSAAESGRAAAEAEA